MPRTKAEWRRWAADILPATPTESAVVCAEVLKALRDRALGVVLTFLAMPGEVDLSCLQEDPGLTLGATRTPRVGSLTIHRLEGELETHPYGFPQPAPEAKAMDPTEIEAVLVPGVLFARNGGRLGHGRGYYDQLLSSLPIRPWLLGVTLDRRVIDDLPMKENDVWMDAIVTESGSRDPHSEKR